MPKETGVNVASLAGVVLNMTEPEFSGVLRSRGHVAVLKDMKSIAASALTQHEPGEPDPEKYMKAKAAFKDFQGELYFKERHTDGTPKMGKFEYEEMYRCMCDLFGLPR